MSDLDENSIPFKFEEEFSCENLIKRDKPLHPFLVKEVLLGIPTIWAEIFSSPVPHSAQVRAIFKEIIIDMVMLDNLPDVGIYRKSFHFLEGKSLFHS